MRSEGGGRWQDPRGHGEEKDWKEIGKVLCWKDLRLKFSLDRNVSMSRSDGLRFFIERSDGYQAIDDVDGSFARTATWFQVFKDEQPVETSMHGHGDHAK